MKRAIILGLLLAVSTAHADPKADALKLNKAGAKAFDAESYDKAIEIFERSYEVYPSANTLFNIGQAYKKKGDAAKAVEYFQRYLDEKPNAPNADAVRQMIAALQPQVKPPEPPPPVAAPLPAPEPAPPAAAAVPPAAVRDEPSATPRRWTSDALGLSLAGGGLAVTGVGVALIVISGSKSDDAGSAVDETDAVDQNSSARTLRTAGIVTTAVGVAALGAGIVKLFVLPREAPRERGVAWSITPGGILVSGRF